MGHKLEGLQAARAIAALSVAYFHSYVALRAFPELAQHPIPFFKEWGFLGVDFFFAISGYVICLVVTRPDFTMRSFFIKRVFRLYPMYFAAMFLVALMIWAGKFPDPVSLSQYLYSLTLLPTHPPPGPAYPVSWTLEREVVFYALAGLAIPVAGIGGLAVLLAGLAWAGYVLHDPWSFHLASTYQANFLGGVLVFSLSRLIKLPQVAALAALFGGAGWLFFLWLMPNHIFPFATAICLALVLLGMVHVKLDWSHPWLRLLVCIGDASYSIYLLHGIILYYAWWLGAQFNHLPNWLCEVWRFGALGVCCAASWWTWRLIERPFINFGNRIADRRLKPHDAISRSDVSQTA
ncbi:peptidoglycan/LPS O-acetylase OafA/YrhL [Bradyrhizobium japonicum USDA 38]|uniref:acyltransferase family protein n=1 Tax=Bradyrhizobium japonicum TaxID=375 RepID=UPI000420989D|nr:acyltransferase [Bradyrhizobium japonicum]MCS3896128.1 peptidoglycan/LPS O-acetylase OafA/YrhL [Bradyrhizobium japonicum USDA 38]MCS3948642.1 peptidoglycan/LPS O-acetylase OafA/YrhL [Bradyrhizobium japonicum]MCW2218625.1 peptidoglycan/LPS O-acetylase OafA/YrhL [Bradyrhizobium japonicum]MCW2343239.1 peptidoglycan/LPS O-acetylase OafA/YrhL [Bradyrhizobium japonicum]